jgi:hypothetical protein
MYIQWISKVAAKTLKLNLVCATDFGYATCDHPYPKAWSTSSAKHWGEEGFRIMETR